MKFYKERIALKKKRFVLKKLNNIYILKSIRKLDRWHRQSINFFLDIESIEKFWIIYHSKMFHISWSYKQLDRPCNNYLNPFIKYVKIISIDVNRLLTSQKTKIIKYTYFIEIITIRKAKNCYLSILSIRPFIPLCKSSARPILFHVLTQWLGNFKICNSVFSYTVHATKR